MLGLLAATAISAAAPALAQGMLDEGDWQEVDERLVDEGEVEPAPLGAELGAAAELSAQEAEDLQLRLLRMRENYTRRQGTFRGTVEGLGQLPEEEASETEVIDAPDVPEDDALADILVVNPQNLVIGRNSRNTRAQVTTNSTLAEPAAANNGPLVFAAGNFAHAEFSNNGGTNWTNVVLPGGPADAPNLCCDH
jgi:hypothetical protein